MTETGRLETFSDGVFAIAITLLVLGIGVPEPDQPLVAALVDQWPAFVAYVVSFLTIGIMWVNHHQLFLLIGRSNMTFAIIHVVFLMFIAFLPYPTDVLAERLGSGVDEVAATLLYGGTMVAIAVMYTLIWRYASGNGGRLLKPDIDEQTRRAGARGYQFAPIGYLLITLLAFVNPLISLLGFAAYAIYWALPVSGPVSRSEG
ncbi:MAG: TMEM175 family protein [Candidatus Limnocylindria bacterium]